MKTFEFEIKTFIDSNSDLNRTLRVCVHTYLLSDRELLKTGRTSNPRYETMVFPVEGADRIREWIEIDCKRYTDEQAADSGHTAMVEKWKRTPEQTAKWATYGAMLEAARADWAARNK